MLVLFIVLGVLTSSGISRDTFSLGDRNYILENDKVYTDSYGNKGSEMFPYRLIVRKHNRTAPTENDLLSRNLTGGITIVHDRLLGDYYIIEIDLALDPFNTATTLHNSTDFEYVEFDAIARFNSSAPNDSLWNDQWNLQSGKLQMRDAWDINTGDSSILVGTLDNGVNYKHPDLIGNIWQNLGEDDDNDGCVLELVNGVWQFDPDDINGVDNDSNGKVDDFIGWNLNSNNNNPLPNSTGSASHHGTAVAGIIAASTNNDEGLAGIAGGWSGNQGISLVPIKLVNTSGSSDSVFVSSVGTGITYCIENGVDVINLSMTWDYIAEPDWFEDLINVAVLDSECVIVGSSGNDGGSNETDIQFPAAYENVIAVGAAASDDSRWIGSSYGPGLSVLAPGGDGTIKTTHYLWPLYGYRNFGKTSAAAPHVAGVAALLKSEYPELSASEIKEIIEFSADRVAGMGDLNFHDEYGYGRLNAYNAMTYTSFLGSAPDAPQGLRVKPSSRPPSHPKLNWGANTEPDLAGYKIERREGLAGSWTTPSGGNVSAIDTTFIDNDVFILSSNPDRVYYRIRALDLEALYSTYSSVVDIFYNSFPKITTKEGKAETIPTSYFLMDNFPNPFNPNTTIRYGLPEDSKVSLVIYDLGGNVVRTLESGMNEPGWYEHEWNGLTIDGRTVSTGIYFARIAAGDYSKTIKMLYLK